MAKFAREIMNPELFAVEPESPCDAALDYLMALGITACPVIDEAGTFKGMVSVQDLLSATGGNQVSARLSEPVLTIAENATIEDAAQKLTEHHAHRILVVDDKGRAAGMISAVDLVAALIGAPVTHPTTFPRIDAVAGLSWSADHRLGPDPADDAPNEPGVLVLVYGRAGHEEIPVWIESANNLRARLDDILGAPQDALPELAHVLARDRGNLRFRFASVPDEATRTQAVDALREDAARRRRLG